MGGSKFTHTQTVQLPLPEPKTGETREDVRKRGMEAALSLLHNAEVMINHDSKDRSFSAIESTHAQAVDLDKLASDFTVESNRPDDPKPDPDQWKHFEVYEDIPIVFGMTKKIVFYTALRFNRDGMEALTDAGSSVTIHGTYSVTPPEDDQNYIRLTETTEIRCAVLLSWYIRSTMGKTHEKVNSYLKERFVEAMRGKAWT